MHFEVGMPTMPLSLLEVRWWSSLVITKVAVKPVSRPKTMPLLTYSTTLLVASFFKVILGEDRGEEGIKERNALEGRPSSFAKCP